jgi:hypothetical protein
MIVAALVAGSLRGLEGIGQQLVDDGYQVLRRAIIAKHGPRARESIEQLEVDPQSRERQEAVKQHLRCLGVGDDCEIQRLATRLVDLVQNPMAGFEATGSSWPTGGPGHRSSASSWDRTSPVSRASAGSTCSTTPTC